MCIDDGCSRRDDLVRNQEYGRSGDEVYLVWLWGSIYR